MIKKHSFTVGEEVVIMSTKLKELRIEKGYSLDKLAKLSGI